jgi:hypothetical protein
MSAYKHSYWQYEDNTAYYVSVYADSTHEWKTIYRQLDDGFEYVETREC